MFWIRSIWQRTQINVWIFQALFALRKDVLHVVKQYRHMTHETELQFQQSAHIFRQYDGYRVLPGGKAAGAWR